MDPKFRKIPKHSKALQDKILKYPYALHFLTAAGFTQDSETINFQGFDKERLEFAEKAIEDFVVSLGASINQSTFDPYKASVSSQIGIT